MAITFVQKEAKQKYLILFFALIIVATASVIWWGFLKKEKISLPLPPTVTPLKIERIEIDWEILQSAQLEEFQAFERVSPFEGEIGRENPFVPY